MILLYCSLVPFWSEEKGDASYPHLFRVVYQWFILCF